MDDRLKRIARRARADDGATMTDAAMPPLPVVDHAAIADAMLGGSRVMRAFARARAESTYEREWEVEAQDGETTLQAMERVLDERRNQPISIIAAASPVMLRHQFAALTPDERADEVDRHMWALADATRPRTIYSDLLSSMGIGRAG